MDMQRVFLSADFTVDVTVLTHHSAHTHTLIIVITHFIYRVLSVGE